MKLGIFTISFLFILNAFAIETKGDLKIEILLHTCFLGYLSLGLAAMYLSKDLARWNSLQ